MDEAISEIMNLVSDTPNSPKIQQLLDGMKAEFKALRDIVEIYGGDIENQKSEILALKEKNVTLEKRIVTLEDTIVTLKDENATLAQDLRHFKDKSHQFAKKISKDASDFTDLITSTEELFVADTFSPLSE